MNAQVVYKEIKETLNISLPLILAQLIQSATPFAGVFMIAHLGEKQLAASALVNITWMTLTVFLFGILNSVSVMVSHQFGANNLRAISLIMGQALIMTLLLILVTLALFPLTPELMRWGGQSSHTINLARNYTHSLLWATAPLMLLIVLEQFLYGIHRTKIILWVSLFQIPLEIFMMYIFIFGKLGLPKFGIAGAGYGQAIVFTLSAIGFSIYLFAGKTLKQYKVFSAITFRYKAYLYLFEMIKIGLPVGGMYLVEVGAFFVVTLMMGHLSSEALAAHQIAFQFLGFTITAVFGMGQAVTVRVGHAMGGNNFSDIQPAAYTGIGIGFVLMLLVAVIYIIFPKELVALDLGHKNASSGLVDKATAFLFVIAIFQLFDSFRLISIGALRGLKDTRIPMLFSFVAFWVIALPLAYWFAFVFHLGGTGIWSALAIGVACGSIMVFLRFRHLSGLLSARGRRVVYDDNKK